MNFLQYLGNRGLRHGRHVGVDIGGANLKLCQLETDDNQVRVLDACSVPFALWQKPEELCEELSRLLPSSARTATVSVTMTGEIADCFLSKQQGVSHIVAACQKAWAKRAVGYFRQDVQDCFVDDETARDHYLATAASNWFAVTRLLGPVVQQQETGNGLILDLGSTTFDLTPCRESEKVTPATDWERMQKGQLVYTGVGRSPLACLLPNLEMEGQTVWLAQELFATARDVYLLSGDLPEDVQCCNTADGRPAIKANAAQRIARMFCSDVPELPAGWVERVVKTAKANQAMVLQQAIGRQIQQIGQVAWVVMMGQGEGILQAVCRKMLPHARTYRLSDCLSAELSEVAPAFAVAALRAWKDPEDEGSN